MAFLTSDAVLALQTLLAKEGFDPGPLDGAWGSKTAAAVRAWMGRSAPTTVATGPIQETTSVIRQGKAGHVVDEIVVHCSATVPTWMGNQPLLDKIAEIRRWHQARGWSREGYHWFIDRDGKILPGRPETVIGAHVVERNQGTIGICLIGGHGSAETDQFEDNFTAAQDVSLRQLIQAISMRTRIRRVSGHNEYAAKSCPGFSVTAWLGNQ